MARLIPAWLNPFVAWAPFPAAADPDSPDNSGDGTVRTGAYFSYRWIPFVLEDRTPSDPDLVTIREWSPGEGIITIPGLLALPFVLIEVFALVVDGQPAFWGSRAHSFFYYQYLPLCAGLLAVGIFKLTRNRVVQINLRSGVCCFTSRKLWRTLSRVDVPVDSLVLRTHTLSTSYGGKRVEYYGAAVCFGDEGMLVVAQKSRERFDAALQELPDAVRALPREQGPKLRGYLWRHLKPIDFGWGSGR